MRLRPRLQSVSREGAWGEAVLGARAARRCNGVDQGPYMYVLKEANRKSGTKLHLIVRNKK